MKLLIVHNFYQIRGGEDSVMENEIELLESFGETVVQYSLHNNKIDSTFSKLKTLCNVPFSFSQYRNLIDIIKIEQPDVVHVHNYFPLLSPSVFYACSKMNIPVVHTLHNYRAVCPTAFLIHNGKINERSILASSWWTVNKKVYRGSFIGSLVLACMVEFHKYWGTWKAKVDHFIALTDFSRDKFIEAGWPKDKISVKPNFISDPHSIDLVGSKHNKYALYVGRLSQEKGIDVLLEAWKNCGLPLKVVGDGPLAEFVEQNSIGSVEYLGLREKPEVIELMKHASFIVMPSTWYEGFPMVLVEAFACGTPALVSKLGSMEEIVTVEETGLHFEAGNEQDLAEKVRWMVENPEYVSRMGVNARQEYLSKYTPEKNYELLMDVYEKAIKATRSLS